MSEGVSELLIDKEGERRKSEREECLPHQVQWQPHEPACGQHQREMHGEQQRDEEEEGGAAGSCFSNAGGRSNGAEEEHHAWRGGG